MILTEQEAIALGPTPQKNFALATVAGVHTDGLSLRFAGEDAPTQKHYLCAGGCVFKAGQRVLVAKVSGEYVVLCTVGVPVAEIVVDRAKTADVATAVKNSDTNYAVIKFTAPYTNQLRFKIDGYNYQTLRNQ